jgi:hypothetical protein
MLALGFFTFSQPGIRTQAARHSPWLLALGAALCAGLLVPWTEPPAAAVAPLRACAAWTLCLGILGLGIRLLGGARPLPAGLNERVLPLYLLGLPAILACGRLFARWDAPDALKLPSLCIAGLLVIAGLTEVALRVNVLRFLCGLKPLSRPQKKGASYSANGGNGK